MSIRIGRIPGGILAALLAVPALCEAEVKGWCDNCHTMHNSQQGQTVAFTRDAAGHTVAQNAAFSMLLKTDCVGCHTNSGPDTIVTTGDTRVPIVFNLTEPTYPPNGSPSSALAGGNFFWVTQKGDPYGHNVLGISTPDLRLAIAPGDTVGATNNCATCHVSLAQAQGGCTGCHVPQHHAKGTSLVAGRDAGWYRFLGSVMQKGTTMEPTPNGVTGIEDPNWEQSPLPTRHNVYQGSTTPAGTYLDNGSISQKCSGCHGQYHNQTLANSAWIRHPVDAVIPTTNEFSGLTSYDPLVPVARRNVSEADVNFSSVNKGSDVVACISCHRPHGSPYPAMLRWAYRAWPGIDPQTGQPAVNGCARCHTAKD